MRQGLVKDKSGALWCPNLSLTSLHTKAARMPKLAAQLIQVQGGMGFRNIEREAKAVKPEAADAWNNTLLPQVLQEYPAKDIYITDSRSIHVSF